MPEPDKPTDPTHDRRSFFRQGLSHLLQPAANYVASKLPDIASNLEGIVPGETRPLRPPGALPESAFLNTCYRCGSCADHCPADAITLLRVDDKTLNGTPTIDPTRRACVVCDDLTCMKVCPSGALKLVGRTEIRIGLAVWDEETCLRPTIQGPASGKDGSGEQSGGIKRGNGPGRSERLLRKLVDFSAKLRTPSGKENAVTKKGAVTQDSAAIVRERMASDFESQPRARDDAAVTTSRPPPTNASAENCTICVDVCPFGTDAIYIEEGRVRVIDPRPTGRGCTGCGVCQEQCPTRPRRAIRVLPYALK